MKTQSRFSNGGLWLSLFFLTVALLTYLGLGGIVPLGADVVVTGIVTIFTFLGIVTNPKDGKWYWSPNTPWKTRLTDYKMWVAIVAVLAEIVMQILKWLNILTLPFNMTAALMTFLNILQATGILNGTPVSVTSMEDAAGTSTAQTANGGAAV